MVCSLYSQWFRGVHVRKNGVWIMFLKATKVQQGVSWDSAHQQLSSEGF